MSHPVKECVFCGRVRQISGKGMCGGCYGRQRKHGTAEARKRRCRSICTVPECGKVVVSRGLCDAHRIRVRRFGQIETLRPADWGQRGRNPLYVYWADTKKREGFNFSEEWKTDFWAFVSAVGERPSQNHFIRAIDISKALGSGNWQWVEGLDKARKLESHREKRRNHDRKRLRISGIARDKLMEAANHRCEICGGDGVEHDCPVTGAVRTKHLCIDHCHATGIVRGVLCKSCNSALGYFKDDVTLLEKAVQYLTSRKAPT